MRGAAPLRLGGTWELAGNEIRGRRRPAVVQLVVATLDDLLDRDELEAAVTGGYVRLARHPSLPLTIANYTAKAQFDRMWTPVTRRCRGLVYAGDGTVVARPFEKFFNYGDVVLRGAVATMPPLVTTKVDGSLGVLMAWDGERLVSTRGSFVSAQAVAATRLLRERYGAVEWPAGCTPLVEIVYPANRVVVDYGDLDDLVLLAAIDQATGADIPLWEVDWWPGPVVEQHYGLGVVEDVWRVATSEAFADGEGVVATWLRPGEPSFRLKIKHPDYVRLHRLVTGASTSAIWEILAAGDDPLVWLEGVPDELYAWCATVIAELRARFAEVEAAAREVVAAVPEGVARRDAAAVITRSEHPGIAFRMLDGKPYVEQVWRAIRPEWRLAPTGQHPDAD